MATGAAVTARSYGSETRIRADVHRWITLPAMSNAPASTGSANPPSLMLMVIAGSLIAALALGVRSTFGLFIDPITDSIGVGKGTIGLAIAIRNLCLLYTSDAADE